MSETSKKKPIDFSTRHERDRWVTIYERELDRGKSPWRAAETASDDMDIRRRVFPMAVGRMEYADLLTICQVSLPDLASELQFRASSARDPSGSTAERVADIKKILNMLEARHAPADVEGH